MTARELVNPPLNTSAAAASAPRVDDAPVAGALPALVESYQRLADVFHEVLSEQSLDALLERIADTVSELIPHDDLAFYEADESAGDLRAVLPGASTRTRCSPTSRLHSDRGSRAGPSSSASRCSRIAPTSIPGFALSRGRRPIRSR